MINVRGVEMVITNTNTWSTPTVVAPTCHWSAVHTSGHPTTHIMTSWLTFVTLGDWDRRDHQDLPLRHISCQISCRNLLQEAPKSNRYCLTFAKDRAWYYIMSKVMTIDRSWYYVMLKVMVINRSWYYVISKVMAIDRSWYYVMSKVMSIDRSWYYVMKSSYACSRTD